MENCLAPAEVSFRRKTQMLSVQSGNLKICALIAVLPLPSSDTCSNPSQTKDGEGIQHKYICICSPFTAVRVLYGKLIQIIASAV